jgi:hypothetical protein
MASCSLSGPLPSSLPSLFSVVEVDVSNNLLTGPVPPVWVSTQLSRLALSNNRLSGPCSADGYPYPVFLGAQTQLLSLDLSGNPLNCPASTLIGGLAVAQCIVQLDDPHPTYDISVCGRIAS